MNVHTKAFGIYHWDTFEPPFSDTMLVGEADTLVEAEDFVEEKFKGRISPTGADQVHIVDRSGEVQRRYYIR